MYLTKEEELILEGEFGPWQAKAMRLLVALGDLFKAEKFVDIKRAHLSGVSYKTVGDPILEMLEDIANSNIRVKTFTTLNPSGMDLTRWKSLGFPKTFAEKQLRIINAFKKMGVKLTLTCAPYFFENRPKFGENVAFAESSVVVYTNSLIGARTNRHGNLDALAAAIIGKVPLMGLLLKENRKADLLVKVNFKPKYEYDFGLIGLYIGDKIKSNDKPAFIFDHEIEEDHLRSLGASLAASGGVPMFHVIGITPEAKTIREAFQNDEPGDKITINAQDIIEFRDEKLGNGGDPDLIVIGCPHASLNEIKIIASKVKNRKIKENLKFWIFTSRHVRDLAKKAGFLKTLENAGIEVLVDTCMVVSPLEDMGVRHVITNSGKAMFYIPKLSRHRLTVEIRNIDEILQIALE